MDETIQTQNICTGNFDESGSLYYYKWKGPHFYTGFGRGLFLLVIFLMIVVKIGRYQMNKYDQKPNTISTPKDLDSILLNFTLMSSMMVSAPLRAYLRKKYVFLCLH